MNVIQKRVNGELVEHIVDGIIVKNEPSPLIENVTNILKPCSGCGKDLSDPVYDQFWNKGKK